MRALLVLVLLLSGCSSASFSCPHGDVELRSREPVIERMADATAPKPAQQIECVAL